MKKLFYCCLAVAAFTFFYACSDDSNQDDGISNQSPISKVRFDGDGDPDGGGVSGSACPPETCYGTNYGGWYATSNHPCMLCVGLDIGEEEPGEMCLVLTNVSDPGTGAALPDFTVSGTVNASGDFCYEFENSINFTVAAYYTTPDGCDNNSNLGYHQVVCPTCCELSPPTIEFEEVQTDLLYQIICGQIHVNLNTECEGPISYTYSPEPGTGLKASGSGTGTSFIIDVQDDCGLAGPGDYTVTFSNGGCLDTTVTYYFEPCNSDLYDPANPAQMQMTDLNISCTSSGFGVRMTSQTVAKCCNCTSVIVRLTNGNGVVTEFTQGTTTMEAGCQPATSYFKKIIKYSPFDWTEWGNMIEIIDCEGNVIYTDFLNDPCL